MFTVKILSKWAGIGLGSVLLFAAVAYGAMRMNDGPVEFYPWFTISIGGPFRSGELTAAPQSWEFLQEREEIEIQTLKPTTSRTVWVPIADGALSIVSGHKNSRIVTLWKQWLAYRQ